MVALLHQNLGNGLAGVHLDFLGLLRHDHAGKLHVGNHSSSGIYIGNRTNICQSVRIRLLFGMMPDQHARHTHGSSCRTSRCTNENLL